MRHFLFSLLFTSIGIFSYAQVQSYNVGDIVNDFTVTDTHGVEHNLYDITASGKYVFLDFFFRNCGPCQQTSRYFYQLYETYGENQQFTYMLSLSPIDDNATITEFENLYNGGFPPPPGAGTEGGAPAVISDFGVAAYPTYCIIGPDNRLIVGDIWPVSGMETFESHFPQELWDLINSMGTGDLNIQNQFSVYPTVSDGSLNIDFAKNSDATVSVFNMNGQQVYEGVFMNQKNVQLHLKLSTGIYVIKIQTADKTQAQKIIIK
ncbi:MAG: T9SS type A sorting domain-containing protein [Weeksellaceae bacterium]|jgi:thiol-disulfide isomerase/thioredoxin|nr:T9SS type A sorting domain-containing protein [Weeksellaceae bacterium]